MSDSEARRINKEEIHEAVHETLRTLGVDVDNPREFQNDLQTLRRIRTAKERSAAAAIWAITVAIVSGVGTLAWQALKNASRGSG